jgi:nucleoside-diphosphate-sugar epimerase
MKQENALVVGATSLVGKFVVDQLAADGVNAIGLCRRPPADNSGHTWIAGDLQQSSALREKIPDVSVVYSAGPIQLLPDLLPILAEKGVHRVVAISSTGAISKIDSEVANERIAAQQFLSGERGTIEFCESRGIAWTILRPTLIYVEGFDKNVSRIAEFIQKFRFFPIVGAGHGLRQPVHGADVAVAMVRIGTIGRTAGKIYELPGGETLPYTEVVGRVFDSMNLPRRVLAIPVSFWRLAARCVGLFVPGVNSATGNRMSEDLVYDSTTAVQDFGWNPRDFRPSFGS